MRTFDRSARLVAFVIPLTLCFAACGDDGGDSTDGPGIDAPAASVIPAECNPLGGQGCMLPWPSMAYTKAVAANPTGLQLDIPREAMPVNADDKVFEPTSLNRWDGFSAVAPMLAMFPTGVSADGLPTWKDPAASLAPSSPIVLLDMDTGERTVCFAEVDQNVVNVTKRALIIRPLARLHPKHRYVVAIRNTVKAADGSALPMPEGFAAIVNGTDYNHPRFAALAARYPAIFDALATAGVQKSELVLAWDFVVASDEMLTRDLTTMRAAALPAIGTAGANLSFVATPSPAGTGHAHYLGTYKSPNFLTDGEMKDSVLKRDASTALPVLDGLRDARFAAIVPKCAETHTLPLPTIIFGHGIFGSAEEYLDNGFVQRLAEDHCFVVIAGDFIGLTSREITLAPLAVNDLNRATQVTEKLAQSIMDFIALENVARGPMHAAPEFAINGTPVIDPANTFYVGGSLGGIMGNAIMAYDPNFKKGVLAVPGGNWSLLLERSNAWSLLMGAAQAAYDDDAVYQLNLVIGLGMGLEPYDPITTAAHVIKDPLFGGPAKQILMWYSLGDCLVTNISTEMVAREMGISVIGPSVKSPFGLTVESPPTTNGITVFDEHPTPLPADTNTPPTQDNGTHSGINQRPAAIREVVSFLLDNTVANGCLGPTGQPAACDCATGACD